ncbi:MAG: hypothetical protein KBT27_13395 [Prevotellaceae bacterium]|nr:hypothetical protein [Candidatus Faecinaster equi]
MKYTIKLEGCDDDTIFDMELTPEEYELVERISVKSLEVSEYCCMPRLYVKSEQDIEECKEAK